MCEYAKKWVWLSSSLCFSLIKPIFMWPCSQISLFENIWDMTGELRLASYNPKCTSQCPFNMSFCALWSKTWNYGHLISTSPTVGKWKVVKPGNRYNVCREVTRSGHNQAVIFNFSSAPNCIHNHVLTHHIMKITKVCVMWAWLCKCGYCYTYTLKSL